MTKPRVKRSRLIIKAIAALIVSVCAIKIILIAGEKLIVDQQPMRSDVIVVLGYPSLDDGQPSQVMKSRVNKGVSLFLNGYSRSNRIIFSGASVKNQYKEAEIMSQYAASIGIPGSAVIIEDQSTDTITNAYYCSSLMMKNNWTSAIVVTSPYHTNRAMRIFSNCRIKSVTVAAESFQHLSIFQRLKDIIYEWGVQLYYKVSQKDKICSIQM